MQIRILQPLWNITSKYFLFIFKRIVVKEISLKGYYVYTYIENY